MELILNSEQEELLKQARGTLGTFAGSVGANRSHVR